MSEAWFTTFEDYEIDVIIRALEGIIINADHEVDRLIAEALLKRAEHQAGRS